MRARFGRGRRGKSGAERKSETIDAGRCFQQLIESQRVPVESLETLEVAGVPADFAAVGSGQTSSGETLVVAYAPRNGGDAVLALLAHLQQSDAETPFAGEALAIAPSWSIAARRRLALVGGVAYRLRALSAPALDSTDGSVEAERESQRVPVAARRLAEACEGLGAPELFLRGLAALEGLAAKHGGSVRGTDTGAELVLLARRCAVLRPGDGGVVLETVEPERATVNLSSDGLAAAFDRLEGALRKRLNDRKVKGGEEGVRARAIPGLVAAAGLHAARAWPLAGSDPEVIDVLGLDAAGRPVLGVVREEFDLVRLAEALDALAEMRPALAGLLAESAGPLRLAEPRLALAAERFDAAVLAALSGIAIDHDRYTLLQPRSAEVQVVHSDSASGAPSVETRPGSEDDERGRRPRRRRRGGRRGRGDDRERTDADESVGETEGAEVSDAAVAAEAPEAADLAADAPADAPAAIEEMSLFDLDDDSRGEDGGPRRRRRRGRRRGGRRGGETNGSGNGAAEASDSGGDDAPEADDEDDLVDADADPAELLAPVDETLLDGVAAEPAYDDDEEEEGEEGDSWMAEREARRQAREERQSTEPVAAAAVEENTAWPRKRSAIVVHADADSVMAGILLARDVRMLEGFWVYPQEDLMTFFRGVATDLKGDTPIYVLGFNAKPARETLQAASLYTGRLFWFDHHDWPPEDLESLRGTLGPDRVEVEPGGGSSIPAVLARRQRRSRFSDKLVELATGRFTQHDYERWGRVWAERLKKIAGSRGEQRPAIDPLLAGRPSDLAKEAARAAQPDAPAEVAFVSGRDFRVVHFGGFALVVVPVDEGLDPYLTARLARERFGARVSLTYLEGEDLVLLGGDEARGRGSLDLGKMVAHLAAKHAWVSELRDDDHVARMRVHDLQSRPERLDDVVAEVAMGRSILEG